MKNEPPAIGIVGGSGLYQMEDLSDPTEHKIDTPFGSPSDILVGGKLSGRQVYFLPRHGRGDRILPHEINHQANIYALRSLNVRWIISVAAVGSLQEKYAPRDVLLPSWFYDRTSRRGAHPIEKAKVDGLQARLLSRLRQHRRGRWDCARRSGALAFSHEHGRRNRSCHFPAPITASRGGERVAGAVAGGSAGVVA